MKMKATYLNVAEKPSVAKSCAIILSENRYSCIESASKYNPVYSFDFLLNNQQCIMLFTSVTGHLTDMEFQADCKNWKAVS
jgi:DNA topoisomerase III